ncbi:hypothetical protein RQP46_007315 [Phenoliferia psychrophenolica]
MRLNAILYQAAAVAYVTSPVAARFDKAKRVVSHKDIAAAAQADCGPPESVETQFVTVTSTMYADGRPAPTQDPNGPVVITVPNGELLTVTEYVGPQPTLAPDPNSNNPDGLTDCGLNHANGDLCVLTLPNPAGGFSTVTTTFGAAPTSMPSNETPDSNGPTVITVVTTVAPEGATVTHTYVLSHLTFLYAPGATITQTLIGDATVTKTLPAGITSPGPSPPAIVTIQPMPPADVTITNPAVVTDLSANLTDVVRTLDIGNAFSVIISIVPGFTKIISTLTADVGALGQPGMAPVGCGDADAIVNALADFVEVHQNLLGVVIGKRGLLNTIPGLQIFVFPINAVLTLLEGIVDTVAGIIIGFIPSRACIATQKVDALKASVQDAIQAFTL